VTDCFCESCRPHDPAPTYTEAFKRNCLVMDIVNTPTREARRARIARWRQRHGDASADALMDEVMEAFKRSRASAAGGETPAAGFDNVVSGEPTMTHVNFSMRGSA
jgi:MoxR-like ATPase